MFHPLRAFKNSLNGLKLAWAEDQSFRMTTGQFILGIVLATVMTLAATKGLGFWLLLTASLFPMWITETVNSSIEAVTDKASPERHPLAKKAKDIGSAAVLQARILAGVCWICGFIML